jgi:hypothetical protein
MGEMNEQRISNIELRITNVEVKMSGVMCDALRHVFEKKDKTVQTIK